MATAPVKRKRERKKKGGEGNENQIEGQNNEENYEYMQNLGDRSLRDMLNSIVLEGQIDLIARLFEFPKNDVMILFEKMDKSMDNLVAFLKKKMESVYFG